MKHFIKWVLLLTSLSLVTTIPAHALDLDSLYTVFSNSRGEKRVQAANEILEFAYENEYILTLYTLTNSDDQAFVNATVHSALGSYHLWEKGDYKRSTEFLVLALEYYEKNRDATEVNSLNGNIGNNYARIGDYENAVTYLLKCYEWEKGEGDNEALSSTLNSLGVVYSQWQKPDIAIRYFEEAVQIERPLNRPLQYATRLASLAKEYTFVDVSKSLPLIKEAMQYNEKIEPPNLRESRIAVHNILMGDVYYALDSLGQAANCYQKALTFFEKTGHPFHIATTLQALGRTQVTQHKFPEAVTTLRRSLEIAERNKLLNVQLYSSLYLSEAYSFIESKPLSHFYLKEYTLFKDSLFRQTTQQQLNDFQVKYETAEKQLEIERQQTEIERHQTRQFILVGGLIAAGLLLGLLVYNIRLRARRNQELAQMNAIKDKFFSIISHDLKNPAIAQRDALQLLAESGETWDAGTLSNYSRQLLKSANSLTDLLKNLLNWAQIQTGREIYHPVPFNLVAALQPDIDVIKSMAARKGITFEAHMPPSAIITGDENMLITVVRNLLTNAIKFTFGGVHADGGLKIDNVSLHISETDSKYTISVTDTGVGMSPEQIQNLFRIDRQHSKRGTADESGTGLGLIVCHDMLQKHGSMLHVESQEGRGSRFWFEL